MRVWVCIFTAPWGTVTVWAEDETQAREIACAEAASKAPGISPQFGYAFAIELPEDPGVLYTHLVQAPGLMDPNAN